MKQKKLVYYFLILSISLTLLLPALNLSFAYKYRKINLQSFSKQQLFSTDNLESIRNYFAYKVFNLSLNEAQVIVGKDDFFFLGNGFGGIIDKYKGTFTYSNKEIDIWTNKLNKLQAWYENQGIQFIIVIAPNKHTVYSDKLPYGILHKKGETVTDDMVNSLHKKNIHVLDLKKVLRENKQEKQLFFRTDTHWNNYGAHIGYMNTLEYLNAIYAENYKVVEYSMTETLRSGGGDLTNFLKINHLLSNNYEKNYNLILKNKSQLCYGIITETNKLTPCTAGIKNKFNQYSINKSSPNKKKLLYFCDSFGLANSQLYQETFNTVWRFHLAYKSEVGLANFIQNHKPDVVIYQVVERELSNNYYNIPHK